MAAALDFYREGMAGEVTYRYPGTSGPEFVGVKMGSSSVGIAQQYHPAPWSNNRITLWACTSDCGAAFGHPSPDCRRNGMEEIRGFATTTSALSQTAAWFRCCGVTRVVGVDQLLDGHLLPVRGRGLRALAGQRPRGPCRLTRPALPVTRRWTGSATLLSELLGAVLTCSEIRTRRKGTPSSSDPRILRVK